MSPCCAPHGSCCLLPLCLPRPHTADGCCPTWSALSMNAVRTGWSCLICPKTKVMLMWQVAWATGLPWRQGMAAGRFVRHGDVENILGKDHGNSVHFCLWIIVKVICEYVKLYNQVEEAGEAFFTPFASSPPHPHCWAYWGVWCLLFYTSATQPPVPQT